MVRAILDGRKTQTRRALKSQHSDIPSEGFTHAGIDDDGDWVWWRGPFPLAGSKNRIGAVGDRLWVRETFASMQGVGVKYRADNPSAKKPSEYWDTPWKPSIFMPREYSRITLEVSSVRVEKLKAIKGKDILAEGAVARPHDIDGLGKCPVSAFDGKCYVDLISLWASGWDSINGKTHPWASNPWVWVITFRRIET